MAGFYAGSRYACATLGSTPPWLGKLSGKCGVKCGL